MVIRFRFFFVTAFASAQALSNAAEPLLPDLIGTWSTARTPFGHGTRKIDLYLEADGSGTLIGSTTAGPADSSADATPPLNALISMSINATLDGDILTTRPRSDPPGDIRAIAKMTLTCRYVARESTMQCADPNGVTLDLLRRSGTITPDVANMIDMTRSQKTIP